MDVMIPLLWLLFEQELRNSEDAWEENLGLLHLIFWRPMFLYVCCPQVEYPRKFCSCGVFAILENGSVG